MTFHTYRSDLKITILFQSLFPDMAVILLTGSLVTMYL